MAKVSAILHLVRMTNSLALACLFLATRVHFVAAELDGHDYFFAGIWLLLAAFAYAINDYLDIHIDKINNPYRPLPSGQLTAADAIGVVGCLGILVILLTIYARPPAAWPISVLLASVAYSLLIRPCSPAASNLVAGALVACVPLSAADFAVNSEVALFSVGLGLLIVARELQKDILDAQGDSRYRPVALMLGNYAKLASAIYPILLALSFAFINFVLGEKSGLLVAAVLAPIFIAALLHWFFLHAAHVQARYIKTISYLLVPLLLAANLV